MVFVTSNVTLQNVETISEIATFLMINSAMHYALIVKLITEFVMKTVMILIASSIGSTVHLQKNAPPDANEIKSVIRNANISVM